MFEGKPLPSWLSEDDARALHATYHVERIEEDRLILVQPMPAIDGPLFLTLLLVLFLLPYEDRLGPYLLRLALRLAWIFFLQKALFSLLPERRWVFTFFPGVDHHVREHLGLRWVCPNAPLPRPTVEASTGRWNPLYEREYFLRKETRTKGMLVMNRLFPAASEASRNPWQPPALPDGLLPNLPNPVDQWSYYQLNGTALSSCTRDKITFRASRTRAYVGWLIGTLVLYVLVQGSCYETVFLSPFISKALVDPEAIRPGLKTLYFELTPRDHLISFAGVAAYVFLLWLPRGWPRGRLEIPNGEGVLVLKRFARKTKRVPFLKSCLVVLGDHDLYELGKPRVWYPYSLGLKVGRTPYFLNAGMGGREGQARFLFLYSHGGWEQAVADHLERLAARDKEDRRKEEERRKKEEG